MQIGDRVRLRKGSKFYYQAPERSGVITHISVVRNDWCTVEFDNGVSNGYRHTGNERDLELLSLPNLNKKVIKAINLILEK